MEVLQRKAWNHRQSLRMHPALRPKSLKFQRLDQESVLMVQWQHARMTQNQSFVQQVQNISHPLKNVRYLWSQLQAPNQKSQQKKLVLDNVEYLQPWYHQINVLMDLTQQKVSSTQPK